MSTMQVLGSTDATTAESYSISVFERAVCTDGNSIDQQLNCLKSSSLNKRDFLFVKTKVRLGGKSKCFYCVCTSAYLRTKPGKKQVARVICIV